MKWLLVAGVACVVACGSATKAHKTEEPHATSVQSGLATWYGREQHGGPTASGERFNRFAFTAAHRSLPMNTRVRVTNTNNGRSVVVRINDRGPYGKKSHIIDVSEAAARELGMIDAGIVPVRVEVLK